MALIPAISGSSGVKFKIGRVYMTEADQFIETGFRPKYIAFSSCATDGQKYYIYDYGVLTAQIKVTGGSNITSIINFNMGGYAIRLVSITNTGFYVRANNSSHEGYYRYIAAEELEN